MSIIFYILSFFAGICLHMSLLHLFDFYETQHHPIIAKAKNPYLASKIWGAVQLALAVIILALEKYEPGRNVETLFVILGFVFWAIFLGVFAGKSFKNSR